MVQETMNAAVEADVTELREWLEQSIRRAWILAIAVAIPGSAFLILWFPYSTQMLITVAILGVAVGTISEAVGRAKRRRLEETSEITSALRRAVQELTRVIEEKSTAGTVLESDDPSMAAHHAAVTAHAAATNRLMVEEVRLIHRTLATILERLPAEPVSLEEFTDPYSPRPKGGKGLSNL